MSIRRSPLTVYLVSVHPPLEPTLKMAVWLCLPCWSPEFREEIWCAKSVSDNSGCLKPCLVHLFLFTQNTKAHMRDIYCAEHKTKFQFYKVYSSASANSGSYVTHPSTQTYDRMNDRCLFFTLQVSRKDSVGQEGAVMSIQWQMVHTKPERTVRQKNNSHHLSAFAHFRPSQKQETVWLVAWIKVIFFWRSSMYD